MVKAYPDAKFICHGATWWARISGEPGARESYPRGPIKPAGLVERLLGEYENVFGDLSARSGLNAMTRDPGFSLEFLKRQGSKLIWGSDCECRDGKGGGSANSYCLAARSLSTLAELVPDRETFRRIVYQNGSALIGLKEG
jgi:hypothetical protein